MQVPIINGVFTDMTADYRTSYPLNLVPVPKQNGISEGYLRKADGIKLFATTDGGVDRGGINWLDVCYRVVGSSLYRVASDGSLTNLGSIAGGNQCRFVYSFDRLAIAGGNCLYYLGKDGVLTQVTDEDLKEVKDVTWIDGYFITTDGEYIVQTELNDPTQVSATKYGSSEIDPDPITGIMKVRNELCVFNRYTIEVFDNTGGANFAFQRIEGAMMTKGCVGSHAKCLFAQSFAFVGSGKNEPCSVYLGANGGLTKVATREIEVILSKYTERQLVDVVLEAKEQGMHQHLYLHLPDKTMVYDFAASQVMQQPVWFELSSSSDGNAPYRAINHVWCYNKWLVGDRFDGRIGVLDNNVSTHYDEPVCWQIDTTFIYNGGLGGQIKSIELVGLFGRVRGNDTPTVFLSWTYDGLTWSNEQLRRSMGGRGDYQKRIVWLRVVGMFRQMVGLRFRGCDDSLASFTTIEVDIEPLGVM